jgi:superfamily I DNA/RNA helicase
MSSVGGTLATLLERLSTDQRAAATADAGPVLCVAPAGSGKTTTLVARIGWRLAHGVTPGSMCGLTFNTSAADELRGRIAPILADAGLGPDEIRIRTFHALGREILLDAGHAVEPLVDRDTILGSIIPDASEAERRRLDDAISRLKLDAMVTAADVAADPEPGPLGRAFVAYERAVAETGGLDFDDLVARVLRALRADERLLTRWRGRATELFVDEVQDVDRSQLALVLKLAAPENRIFLVGDDDQCIYGWRLADVRRILDLADRLPGLRRHDLVVNRRCPPVVVERAARLVARNAERFAKEIRPAPGATGRLILGPDGGDDAERVRHVLDSWPPDQSSRAILARTNRELLPALAVLLERRIPFRATDLPTPLDDPAVDRLLELAAGTDASLPLLVRLGLVRDHGPDHVGATLLGWAAGHVRLESLVSAVADGRRLLADLRRDEAPLALATAHATKGLEFDHVAVLGMDAGRFPSARAIAEAAEPRRALEEERRLAYVAWTRARRSLTLVYDPDAPSPFLGEAFSDEDLGLVAAA